MSVLQWVFMDSGRAVLAKSNGQPRTFSRARARVKAKALLATGIECSVVVDPLQHPDDTRDVWYIWLTSIEMKTPKPDESIHEAFLAGWQACLSGCSCADT